MAEETMEEDGGRDKGGGRRKKEMEIELRNDKEKERRRKEARRGGVSQEEGQVAKSKEENEESRHDLLEKLAPISKKRVASCFPAVECSSSLSLSASTRGGLKKRTLAGSKVDGPC
eukprot:534536-Hanusia_phi.AAC.2